MSDAKQTHILWNPNKNYLGNWDVPKDKDLVLTIDSIAWEGVENYNKPIRQGKKIVGYETDEKRVIRFLEKYKPMICNEENASAILMAHEVKFLEEITALGNLKIAIYAKLGKWFGAERLALRIRAEKPKEEEKLPELNQEHPDWEKIFTKLHAENLKPEYFEKWFVISEETKKLLLLKTK